MRRYRLQVVYDGARFHGWQIQPSVVTVEGALTDALEEMTGVRRKVWGASRTDAGVHAKDQIAAFDDDTDRFDAHRYYRGLNALLPDGIAVARIAEVDPRFHPRHSARGKIYRYRLWSAWHKDPLEEPTSWWVRRTLDPVRMQAATPFLIGEHDFTSFRSAGCDANSPVRELYHVEVRARSPRLIEIEVVGSAFLKHMVRNIVGTLVDVGAGRRDPAWVGEVVAARDRRAAGMKAPAQGLTLHKIFYPDYPWP